MTTGLNGSKIPSTIVKSEDLKMSGGDSEITYALILRMVEKSNLPDDRLVTVYDNLVEQYALSEDNDYLINQIKRSLV